MQSPVNIAPPFSYIEFEPKFNFQPSFSSLLKHDGKNLKLEGDFGTFEYGDVLFHAYQMQFKSPAEHTIGDGKRFPLEV